jgi:hypothetical protein
MKKKRRYSNVFINRKAMLLFQDTDKAGRESVFTFVSELSNFITAPSMFTIKQLEALYLGL